MSRVVSYRRDDDIGPETRAVFPDAPAFILKPALHRCPMQLRLGQSPFVGARRIETRKVRTNALFDGIPFDMRPTLIPLFPTSPRTALNNPLSLHPCYNS